MKHILLPAFLALSLVTHAEADTCDDLSPSLRGLLSIQDVLVTVVEGMETGDLSSDQIRKNALLLGAVEAAQSASAEFSRRIEAECPGSLEKR